MLSVLISFKFKQALTSSSLLSLSSSLFSNFGRGCYRFQCYFIIQHQKLQMVNQIYQFLLHYLPTARSFLLIFIRAFLPFSFFVKKHFSLSKHSTSSHNTSNNYSLHFDFSSFATHVLFGLIKSRGYVTL